MSKLSAVRINNGTAIHLGYEAVSGSGKAYTSVRCGSTSHGAHKQIRQTGLEANKETITCKKCLARLEEEVVEVIVEEEPKLQVGQSFSIPKGSGTFIGESKGIRIRR